MYSLVTRSAIKRFAATAATTSRLSSPAVRFYSSTMHDNDPEVLEQEKQRNLRKEQHKTSAPIRNAPGWNQHLASASEANIKADRSDNHPSEMTEHTIKYLKERHTVESEQIPPASGVNEERLEASEASYERDEISGPLKGAKKTKTEVHSQTVEKDSVVGS